MKKLNESLRTSKDELQNNFYQLAIVLKELLLEKDIDAKKIAHISSEFFTSSDLKEYNWTKFSGLNIDDFYEDEMPKRFQEQLDEIKPLSESDRNFLESIKMTRFKAKSDNDENYDEELFQSELADYYEKLSLKKNFFIKYFPVKFSKIIGKNNIEWKLNMYDVSDQDLLTNFISNYSKLMSN